MKRGGVCIREWKKKRRHGIDEEEYMGEQRTYLRSELWAGSEVE